jgi:hypothetical protein
MNIELLQESERLMVIVRSRMKMALSRMADAMGYATDLGCRPWEFALSIVELRQAGLSDNDLRWLLRKGFVEQAIEVTEPSEEHRTFRPCSGCTFTERVCFVLAEEGLSFALACECSVVSRLEERNGHVRNGVAPTARHSDPPVTIEAAVAVAIPTWDRVRRELRWGDVLVKQFKVPSPNQETILGVFEEEHWPPRIDDPLAPKLDQDPKRRLHDTINTLNRNQKNALLRFFGDGSGQGIRWRPSGGE